MREPHLFLLSGEYETLPKAELEAVLSILDPGHRVILRGRRVVVALTGRDVAEEAVERAAYTKLSARFLGASESVEEEIVGSVDVGLIKELIPKGASIAVRGKRVGGVELRKTEVEGKIGAKILRELPGLNVNLRNPDYTVIFVSEPGLTVVGLLRAAKPKKFFRERLAGKRPFSLPSAMQPDFSRCMVNLARVRLGGRILDPFAGTGGIMIEALLLGYRVYGVEIKRWIAEGGLRNLRRYAPGMEHMMVGDARRLMFRRCFDGVVTDPPYGRSTTVPDMSVERLLERFFWEVSEVLVEGGRVVVAAPAEYAVEELAREAGFEVIEAHLARVHGSLVRRVVVLA